MMEYYLQEHWSGARYIWVYVEGRFYMAYSKNLRDERWVYMLDTKTGFQDKPEAAKPCVWASLVLLTQEQLFAELL